jgi:hypothetical protein
MNMILKMSPKTQNQRFFDFENFQKTRIKVYNNSKEVANTGVYSFGRRFLDEDYHFAKLNYWVQLSLAQALKWVCGLEFRVSKQIVFNLYPIHSTPVSTNYQCDKEQWTRTYQHPMQDVCV